MDVDPSVNGQNWDHQGTEELILHSLTTMNTGQSQADMQ